jgi:flagellar biosynthesis/type III secretory pathway protein FliH
MPSPLQKQSVRVIGYLSAEVGQDPSATVGSRPQPLDYADPSQREHGRLEEMGIKNKLEEEKTRTRLLCEAIEGRGFAAGEAAARAQGLEALRLQQQRLRLAIQALESAAANALAMIETEVVTLSLEIAHKILGHEAQIDPLMLSGVVRSSLARLHPAQAAVLLVAPPEEGPWKLVLAQIPELVGRIQVDSDPTLAPGSCVCRSGFSYLDLSVAGQMGEISRKFKALLVANQPFGETPTDVSPSGETLVSNTLPAPKELAKE